MIVRFVDNGGIVDLY